MPVYDYLCDECGPFTEIRPMSEFDSARACPNCAIAAPRAILTAPHFACMPAATRKAHAVNERRRYEPKTLDQYKASHGAGCAGKTPSRMATTTKSGAKGFPSARPWMISH